MAITAITATPAKSKANILNQNIQFDDSSSGDGLAGENF